MTLFNIPIWTAANPIPGAAYIVSNISSNNFLVWLSIFSILSLFLLKIGSGSVIIFFFRHIEYSQIDYTLKGKADIKTLFLK